MTYLTCTCTHRRKLHEGGNDTIRDKYIFKCGVSGCTCTKYHADEKSRDAPYITKTLLRAFGIGIAAMVSIIIGFLFIDAVLTLYDVSLIDTVETYKNGELQELDYTPKEGLAFIMKAIFGFSLGVVYLYWGMFYLQEYLEIQKRKYMLEEDKV